MTSQSSRQASKGSAMKWPLFLAVAVFTASSGLYASSDEELESQQNQEDPYPVDGPADIMPLAAHEILMDVDKVGENFIAVGLRGNILRSGDGVNWTQSPAPTRSGLNAVAFSDSNNGNAVGHDAVILRTTDGGATWTKQLYAPELERPFLDVQFFGGGKGLATGAYGLMYETSDGGATWDESEAAVREDEWHFNAVIQLGDGSLLLVGEVGNIAHSKDGGASWSRVESPYDGSFFGALPYKQSGAVIYGLRGNAFIIDDIKLARGEPYGEPEDDEEMSDAEEAVEEAVAAVAEAAEPAFIPSADAWKKINTGTILGLLGGTVLPNGDIVLIGTNGKILRSSGGMTNLSHVKNPVGLSLADAIPINNGKQLLMVGEAGAQIIDSQ